MGCAQIWSTIHQQLRVPDLPPDVLLTDWASCSQQVTLVMMRPVVSTAQSMTVIRGEIDQQGDFDQMTLHTLQLPTIP